MDRQVWPQSDIVCGMYLGELLLCAGVSLQNDCLVLAFRMFEAENPRLYGP